MIEPVELEYIEDFFKSLCPKAIPLIGNELFYRVQVNDEKWQKIIGLIRDKDINKLRIRAKYKVWRYLDNKKKITYCSQCNRIINCTYIDGPSRPWETTCVRCITGDSQ